MIKVSYLAFLLIGLSVVSANLIRISLKNKNSSYKQQQNLRDGELYDQSFIDTLFNHNQQLYSGEIQVGLSQKKFQVDFDTGSSLLWLTSKDCKSCLRDGFKNSYQCNQDDGCVQTDIPASIGYEDGSSVKGYIAKVPVSISNLQPITNAILIVEQSVKNKNLETDGLIGLGVYDQYNSNNIPYVESLYRQGIIQKSQFSFYLGFGEKESELVIGGYDQNKIQDQNKIYYHPILLNVKQNNDQDWSVTLSAISFDGIQIPVSSKNIAIVDSGTSTICIRKDIYSILIKHLKQNYDIKQQLQLFGSVYTVKCGKVLPDLNFVLPDKEGIERVYSVPSSFYIFQQGNKCYLGVESQSVDDDVQFILGNVFMRRFVSIFDYSSMSIDIGCGLGCSNCISSKICQSCKQDFVLDEANNVCNYSKCDSNLLASQEQTSQNQDFYECVAICGIQASYQNNSSPIILVYNYDCQVIDPNISDSLFSLQNFQANYPTHQQNVIQIVQTNDEKFLISASSDGEIIACTVNVNIQNQYAINNYIGTQSGYVGTTTLFSNKSKQVHISPSNQPINKFFQNMRLERYFILSYNVFIYNIHSDEQEEILVFQDQNNLCDIYTVNNVNQMVLFLKPFEVFVRDYRNVKKYHQTFDQKLYGAFISDQNIFIYGQGFQVYSLSLKQIQTILSDKIILNCIFGNQLYVCKQDPTNLVIINPLKFNIIINFEVLNMPNGFNFYFDETSQRIFAYELQLIIFSYQGIQKGLLVTESQNAISNIYQFGDKLLASFNAGVMICDYKSMKFLTNLYTADAAQILKIIYIQDTNMIAYFTTSTRYGQIYFYSLQNLNSAGTFFTATFNSQSLLIDICLDSNMAEIIYIDYEGNIANVIYSNISEDNSSNLSYLFPNTSPIGMDLSLETNTILVSDKLSAYKINYSQMVQTYIQLFNSFTFQYASVQFSGQNYYLILDSSNIVYQYNQFQLVQILRFNEKILDMWVIGNNQQIVIIAFRKQIITFLPTLSTSIQMNQLNVITNYMYKQYLGGSTFFTYDNKLVYFDFVNKKEIYSFQFDKTQNIINDFQYISSENKLVIGFFTGQVYVYYYQSLKVKELTITQQVNDQIIRVIYTSQCIYAFYRNGDILNLYENSVSQIILTPQSSYTNSQIQFELSNAYFDDLFNRLYVNFQDQQKLFVLDASTFKIIKYLSHGSDSYNRVYQGDNLLILYTTYQLNIYTRDTLKFIQFIQKNSRTDTIDQINLIQDTYLIVCYTTKIDIFLLNNLKFSYQLIDSLSGQFVKLIHSQINVTSNQQTILVIIFFSAQQITENYYSIDLILSGSNQCSYSLVSQNNLQATLQFQQVYLTDLNIQYAFYYQIVDSLDIFNSIQGTNFQIIVNPQINNNDQIKPCQNQLNLHNNSFLSLKNNVMINCFSFNFTQKGIYLFNPDTIVIQNLVLDGVNITSSGISAQGELIQNLILIQNCTTLNIYGLTIKNINLQYKYPIFFIQNVQKVIIKNITISQGTFSQLFQFESCDQIDIEAIVIDNNTGYYQLNSTFSLGYLLQISGSRQINITNLNASNNFNLNLISSSNIQTMADQTIYLEKDIIVLSKCYILNNTFSDQFLDINGEQSTMILLYIFDEQVSENYVTENYQISTKAQIQQNQGFIYGNNLANYPYRARIVFKTESTSIDTQIIDPCSVDQNNKNLTINIDKFQSGGYLNVTLEFLDQENQIVKISTLDFFNQNYLQSIINELKQLNFVLQPISLSQNSIYLSDQSLVNLNQYDQNKFAFIKNSLQISGVPSTNSQFVLIYQTNQVYNPVSLQLQISFRECYKGEVFKIINDNIIQCYQCPNGCLMGYIGPLCDFCDTEGKLWQDRYTDSSQKYFCSQCSEFHVQIIYISILGLLIFLYIVFQVLSFMSSYVHYQQSYYIRNSYLLPISMSSLKEQSGFFMKILINYLQLTSILLTIKTKIVPSIIMIGPSILGNSMSNLTIDINCIYPQRYISYYGTGRLRQITQFFIPPTVLIILIILFLILERFKVYNIGKYHKYTLISFTFMFFQPDSLNLYSKSLTCRTIGSLNVFTNDTLFSCDDPGYDKFTKIFLVSKVLGKEKTTQFFIKNTISVSTLLRWKKIRANLNLLIQEKQISLQLKSKNSSIGKSRSDKNLINYQTLKGNSENFSHNTTQSPMKTNFQLFNQNKIQNKQVYSNISQIMSNKQVELSQIFQNRAKQNSIENVIFPQQDELIEQQNSEHQQDVSSNDLENDIQYQEDISQKSGVICSVFQDGVFNKQNIKNLLTQK
ncbi:hypothetical protein ABPG73_021048 [Tetrahymena malaccensis]